MQGTLLIICNCSVAEYHAAVDKDWCAVAGDGGGELGGKFAGGI